MAGDVVRVGAIADVHYGRDTVEWARLVAAPQGSGWSMQMACRTGVAPFPGDLVTEFRVTPHPDGSALRVTTPDGFPGGAEADAFYAARGDGWQNTFAGMRKFLAGPESGPAGSGPA